MVGLVSMLKERGEGREERGEKDSFCSLLPASG
jgi:hypothetical protein